MKTRTAILLTLGCIAGAVALEAMMLTEPKRSTKRKRNNLQGGSEKVDVTSDDSFPASDPPSWSSSVASRH